MSIASNLNEGISFTGRAPLALRVLTEPLSLDEASEHEAKNYSLLKSGEISDHSGRDTDPQLEAIISEVQRLDHKLTIIQALLTQLLLKQEVIPERCSFRLSLAKLTCEIDFRHDVLVGSFVLVELFLFEDLPRPISLSGIVRAIEREGNATGKLGVDIDLPSFSDGVDSLLGRFIFRQHRREVATRRSQSAGS